MWSSIVPLDILELIEEIRIVSAIAAEE